MNKKDKALDRLYNSVHSFCSIYCSKCKKVEECLYGDEFDAANKFYNKGWYATENNIYCPECNNKRKKK